MDDTMERIVIEVDTSHIDKAQKELEKLRDTINSINNLTVKIRGLSELNDNLNNIKETAAQIKGNSESIKIPTGQAPQNPSNSESPSNSQNSPTNNDGMSKFRLNLESIGGMATKAGDILGGKLGSSLKSMGTSFLTAAKSVSKLAAVLSIVVTVGKLVIGVVKGVVGALLKVSKAISDKFKNNAFISFLKKLGGAFIKKIIRGLVSNVLSGVTEGINNLVKESARFKSAMDSLATTALYAKNSFAAMAAPLITALAPAISYVVDLLVKATNAIGMFFAALSGAGVFTKAKKKAVEYGKAIGGAGGAAKKLKDYLLDIDELHVLDNKDTGGGGGGGGGIDTSDMFETVNIPEWLSDVIKSDDWSMLGVIISSKINEALLSINWDGISETINLWSSRLITLINSAISVLNWDIVGYSLANGLNMALKFLSNLITGIDWKHLGDRIAVMINKTVTTLDWANVGTVLGGKFIIALEMLHGFIRKFDWAKFKNGLQTAINSWLEKVDLKQAAIDVSGFVVGLINTLTDLIRGINTQKIVDALTSIDWRGIFKATLELVGVVLSKTISIGLPTILGIIVDIILGLLDFDFILTVINDFVVAAIDLLGGLFTTLTNNAHFEISLGFPTAADVQRRVDNIVRSIKNAFKTPFKISFKVPELSIKKTASSIKTVVSSLKTFASGGFVDMGQMFIAREAGPELVGTIGNSTAVINNKQIIEGVSSGVSSAVASVLSAYVPQIIDGLNKGNMTIQVDGKTFGVVARDSINGLVPIFGETGLLL